MKLFPSLVYCHCVISSSLVLAIVEPNCTIKQAPCIGHEFARVEQGVTVEEILDNLRARFCGCVYVTGNIQINMLGLNYSAPKGQLTADDFNMFYHIKEVSEAVRFRGIPDTSDIILPTLQIIRGDGLVGNRYSLVVENSTIQRFILPRLTQISRGDVIFLHTSNLCNYLTVNWPGIIDGGGTLEDGTGTCNPVTVANLLPDCSGCNSGHCWTEEFCQILTKSCNECGEDRCYAVDEAGTTKQCCNAQCAAGCYGSTASNCYACKNLINNGTCVSQCPQERIYDRSLFRTVPNPDYRLAFGQFCVVECPAGYFELQGRCVQECPVSFTRNGKSCVPCNGPCPRECVGLGEVNEMNVKSYNGCTIVTSGLIEIGFQTDFDYSQLESLSTIQEIHGPLRIQGLPASVTSFPYLRNLQKINTSNATVELSIRCGAMHVAFALLLNSGLVSIDLSSLEEIVGGGLVYAHNEALCYTGHLPRYLIDQETQQQCVVSERRPPDQCINESLVCHPQCNSTTDCWGPQDHQCDSCAHFKYINRCVQNCSVAAATLLPGSSGLFQNEALGLCEPCDPECVGGCNEGNSPYNCKACRNFFIRLNESGVEGMLCVPQCPIGTYVMNSTSECVLCYEGCSSSAGCAGPLHYLDHMNGCLGCDKIVLDKNGEQDRCLPNSDSACPTGTYASNTLPPNGQSASLIFSDLPPGLDVCLPCDDLCEVCIRSGVDPQSCQVCKFAQTAMECVRNCNDTEFLQVGSKFCSKCPTACSGCTGPTSYDCIQCAPGFFKHYDDSIQRFACVSECPTIRHFVSMDKVCLDCDPLCEQCVGPGSDNCTSCTYPRFQIASNVLGPNNKTLLKCLNCGDGEELDIENGTCVKDPGLSTMTPEIITGPAIAGIVLGASLLIIAVLVMVFVIRLVIRRNRFRSTKFMTKNFDLDSNLAFQNVLSVIEEKPPNAPPNEARLIVTPKSSLEFGKILGSGAFGTVHEGYWKPEGDLLMNKYYVAIKVLNKETATPQGSSELLEEGVIMASMDHDNIVRLYAVSMGEELMLISQFVPLGSLRSYLKKNKNLMSAHTMLLFAGQIAKGMSYLEEKRMVHRDLAARNVLVQSPAWVKITDFGLTKLIEVGESQYQAQGGKVPVRWMALECLYKNVYTHKSDVWSFGVTVWEILTFGAKPYGAKQVQELLRGLQGGERLEQPATCTLELYAMMLQCWLADPDSRPSFSNLAERLDTFLQDPLRYILTVHDGQMTNYKKLVSIPSWVEAQEVPYDDHPFKNMAENSAYQCLPQEPPVASKGGLVETPQYLDIAAVSNCNQKETIIEESGMDNDPEYY